MNISKKKLPDSQYEIAIEIEDKEFSIYRNKAIKKLSKQVDIPGFRKGAVPEKILVEKFGEEAILAEAADEAIPELLTKAIVQENISPIVRPDVALKSMKPFSFTAKVTVFPDIEIKKWEDIGVAKKEVIIKKKEIDEVVEQLQERFMERKPVDRVAQKKDFVEINFSGKTPDGVPLDGTESKCHPLVLGDGNFIPGFEEQIIGMKKGEEKSFEITFPKDYQAKHLAGKPVIFDVKMLTISEQVKPEVNEEFVEKVFGKKMPITQMRKEIEKMLKEKGEDEERTRRENELIEKWEKASTIEMPKVLIEEELNNLSKVMQDRAQGAGVAWEQYLQNMKQTEEEFREGMRPEAEKRAKQRLVIGKILSETKIVLTDDEIHNAAQEMLHAHHHHHEGETCDHNHDIEKDSDEWKMAAHKLRVERLFDRFLGDHPSKKRAEEKQEA